MRIVWTTLLLSMVLSVRALGDAVSEDPVMARGLSHTTTGRGVAEKAIGKADALLSGSGLRLRGSWQPEPKTKDASDVPVYLVHPAEGANSTPAAVPRGCRCVFVDSELFSAFVSQHKNGPGRLKFDATSLLAFMLLHEAGHIRNRSSGVQFDKGAMSQLNTDPSRAKADEEDADEFAALLIKDGSRPGNDVAPFLAANEISMELTKIGWNMQAYRTLDEFGAAATAKRSVYFDQNYSHPNLAWRILRANDLIQGTPDSRKLLDAFEEIRRRGESAEPLYRR